MDKRVLFEEDKLGGYSLIFPTDDKARNQRYMGLMAMTK
jgi:hypothetical protein